MLPTGIHGGCNRQRWPLQMQGGTTFELVTDGIELRDEGVGSGIATRCVCLRLPVRCALGLVDACEGFVRCC